MLPDTLREVWSHFLTNTQTRTHRFFSARFEGSKVPRDDDEAGVDSGGTLECALETNICAVDGLHFPGCVDTHPADLQHACNRWSSRVDSETRMQRIHSKINTCIDKLFMRGTQMQSSRPSVNSSASSSPCLVSAWCSGLSDPPSAYAELLQGKSLTPSCRCNWIENVFHILCWRPSKSGTSTTGSVISQLQIMRHYVIVLLISDRHPCQIHDVFMNNGHFSGMPTAEIKSLPYIIGIWTISIFSVCVVDLLDGCSGGAEGDIGNNSALPHSDGWGSEEWS